MADLKECDICERHYTPPITGGTFLIEEVAEVRSRADRDIPWDICSPRCMYVLATRRDPALPLQPTGPMPSDVWDTVHEALRWVTTNLDLALDPDADLDVSQRLVASALKRANAAMDAFRPEQKDEPDE